MGEDEASKAVQEVAKTTRKALPLIEKLGSWVAKLIDGPLEQASGIIENELAYIRFERGIRLRIRADQFMKEQGMDGPTRQIPLKVAIPLLQEATLEENDELQDRWARLLVNAARAESEVEVTRKLVSILSDFGPLEAAILDRIVTAPQDARRAGGFVATTKLPDAWVDVPENPQARASFAVDEPPKDVAVALWNLVRLGCVVPTDTWGGGPTILMVRTTALGEELYAACTLPNIHSD